MSGELTTFGLGLNKLAKLWKMGSDTDNSKDNVDREQRKAELLRDWLARTIPLDPALLELLPPVLGQLCRDLQPFVSESFDNVLNKHETDISEVRKIKNIGKRLVRSAKSETDHDAAAVIYYAAIARYVGRI